MERMYSVTIDDGKMEEILAPKGPFQRIQVSPKGTSVAFVSSPEDGPTAQDLFLMPLDTRTPRNLTGSIKDRPVTQFQWLNDSELGALFNSGFHTDLAAVGASPRKLVSDDSLEVSAFAASTQGAVVYVAQSAAVPPELWANGKAGQPLQRCLGGGRFAASRADPLPELRWQPKSRRPCFAAPGRMRLSRNRWLC